MATASPTRQYKEGLLSKRARGLHKKGNLKWQERYCRLTNVSLDYYDPKRMNEPKGQFKVEQIKIVEVVSNGLFKIKANPFQVGDNLEVMYFATKTPQERAEWMQAFRQAAQEKHVKPLPKYHTGVYSLTSKDRWSCCGSTFRESDGCRDTAAQRLRSQTTPLDLDSTPSVSSVSSNSKDELTSSLNSNSTLIEQPDDSPIPQMVRTYTVSEAPMKKPSISRQRRLDITKSVNDVFSDDTPTSSLSTTPTGQVTPPSLTNTSNDDISGKGNDKMSNSIQPPQLEELTRSSGASSPAPSTDSGRGTTSRPSSILTSEGEPAPTTPQSTRSQTLTTDSDQTRSIGGGSEGADVPRRKAPPDSHSIISDISTSTAHFGTLPLHMRKRNANARQSVLYKEGGGIYTTAELSVTSFDTDSIGKLHQGCKEGNIDMVRDELDTGASVGEVQMFNGVPLLPLFISFLYDHRHIMVYLLQHEADPNAVDNNTKSCLLHWACQRGCLETVKILIHFKADVNMRNSEENTPLCEASKNGHLEIVEALLENKALVDFEGSQGHTPLHYATSAGHTEIVETLLKHNANPMKKNSTKQTPYHLAFINNHQDVLDTLKQSLTPPNKPYTLRGTYHAESEQIVTSLSFISDKDHGLKLAAGFRDCHTRVFTVSDEGDCLSLSSELQLANTILSVSGHAPYIAMGSAFIQVADVMSDSGWRRTVADDTSDDESLEDPPLHLVSFTSDGQLVTAGVESNCIKIWPAINDKSVISQPTKKFTVQGKAGETGLIYKLVSCHAPNSPWLGVVVQPGTLKEPTGKKKVYIYNIQEERIFHIIETGHGGVLIGAHMSFSNDGSHFIIACKNNLTKWSTSTGNNVLSSTQDDDITCVAVSPNGLHIAIGLQSGDTHILDSQSGVLVFPLRQHQADRSPVSSLAYSACSSYLATGHLDGSLQLWEV